MSSVPDQLEFLRGVALFAGLTATELADVGSLVSPFVLSAGEELVRQGAGADALFVVQRGSLEAVAQLPGRREVRLGLVGAGEPVGEVALLTGGRRTATLRALEPTVGLRLDRDAFGALRSALRPGGVALARRLGDVVAARLRARCAAVTELLGTDCGDSEGPLADRGVTARDPARHVDYLVRLPLLARLGRDGVREVLEGGQLVRYERGDVVLRAGPAPPACLITAWGVVEAVQQCGAVKQRTRLAGPGKGVAWLGLMDDGQGPVTCRARERSVLLVLPRDGFLALLASATPVGHRLLNAVVSDLAAALGEAERPQAQLLAAGM